MIAMPSGRRSSEPAPEAIAIGICGYDQISSNFVRPRDDGVEHLRVLGIGDVSWHVWKIAVRF